MTRARDVLNQDNIIYIAQNQTFASKGFTSVQLVTPSILFLINNRKNNREIHLPSRTEYNNVIQYRFHISIVGYLA